MEVVNIRYPLHIDKPETVRPSVVAIGYFDGVHLGHQGVLKQARDLAVRLNQVPGVMTFHPHPREVLGFDGYREYLTPLPEKLRQMEHAGMELAYVVHFDRDLAAVSPRGFVEKVLLPLEIKGAVIGFNYTFGHKASGKAEDLQRLSEGRFAVDIVKPVDFLGEKVSSTLLREQLHKGDVQAAAQFLGRPYRIHGTVEHGAGRGKTLGFPTANIRLADPYVVPRTGVYAVLVERQGRTYYGAMNIGYNPTFEADRKTVSVEVHLLDFSADLYGDTLYISFLRYLRPEQKFSSVDELVAQMHEDVRKTRELAEQEQ